MLHGADADRDKSFRPGQADTGPIRRSDRLDRVGAMDVDYHGIQVGMEFEELNAPGGRGILSGRGTGKRLRVFRKRLADPEAWRRVK